MTTICSSSSSHHSHPPLLAQQSCERPRALFDPSLFAIYINKQIPPTDRFLGRGFLFVFPRPLYPIDTPLFLPPSAFILPYYQDGLPQIKQSLPAAAAGAACCVVVVVVWRRRRAAPAGTTAFPWIVTATPRVCASPGATTAFAWLSRLRASPRTTAFAWLPRLRAPARTTSFAWRLRASPRTTTSAAFLRLHHHHVPATAAAATPTRLAVRRPRHGHLPPAAGPVFGPRPLPGEQRDGGGRRGRLRVVRAVPPAHSNAEPARAGAGFPPTTATTTGGCEYH